MMKLGPKNIELFFVAGLVLLTVIEFLLLSAGIISNQLLLTLLNMSIIMVVGGEIIICIILLRIYDKLADISAKKLR
ncbi:MAG: hypothetical protein ABIG84_03045 [archaeon]